MLWAQRGSVAGWHSPSQSHAGSRSGAPRQPPRPGLPLGSRASCCLPWAHHRMPQGKGRPMLVPSDLRGSFSGAQTPRRPSGRCERPRLTAHCDLRPDDAGDLVHSCPSAYLSGPMPGVVGPCRTHGLRPQHRGGQRQAELVGQQGRGRVAGDRGQRAVAGSQNVNETDDSNTAQNPNCRGFSPDSNRCANLGCGHIVIPRGAASWYSDQSAGGGSGG